MNQDLLQPEIDGTPPTANSREREQTRGPASAEPRRGDASSRDNEHRVSVDPMRATDRYRLARPML